MIKKFTKLIRRQLLKIEWIRCRVEVYKLQQKKQRHHEDWAKLMRSGLTIRDYETSAIISDDGIIIDYMDGQRVGQKYVSPVYLDSTNWGVGE